MINEPTLQTNNLCPRCNKGIAPYGTVDIAPLWLQFNDQYDGINREWISERHYCCDCDMIFDRVITNRIIINGE